MSHTTRRRLTLAAIALFAFIALPASAQTINEDIKVVASDATAFDEFGYSVAISGTTAIVGSNGSADSESAYLFDTEFGQQLFKLTASDAAVGDNFGVSVAISGTTAIVGAERDDDAGDFSGSAYLFDTVTGQQLFKLTASDAAPVDQFGISVAISGTIAIVGAPGNDDTGSNSGSAYLFNIVTGQQLFKLTASDAADQDNFGYSVAISGTTAIVGTWHDDDSGSNSGSAYLFDTVTGQQLFKLTAFDAAEDDLFGRTVAISGRTAIVGAFSDDEGGSAYLFDTVTAQQLYKLTTSDAAIGDNFGWSVAISGTTAIVGAYTEDDPGPNTSSGSAYLFDTESGLQIIKLIASDADRNDLFGSSVAIFGSTAIIGATGDDDVGSGSGSAYVFNMVTPCPADLTADGVLDFFDISAFLTAFGDGDPAADFTGDGVFDFFDISAFLTAFSAGCP